jgi:hypothetical protein
MLTVENCIDYLRNNFFTDIHFIGEQDGCLYFTATDEDDTQKEICFEYGDLETVIVSVRENKNDSFVILEKLED